MSDLAEKKNDVGQPAQAVQASPEKVENKGKGKENVEEEDEEEEDEEEEEYNDDEVDDDFEDEDMAEIDPSAIVDTGSRRTRSKVDYSSADARKKAELTDKEDDEDDAFKGDESMRG